MKLPIDGITAEAKELSFHEPEGDINQLLEKVPARDYHIERPIEVDLSYYRAATDLFFDGTLHAATKAVCARCAEEFLSPCDRDFRFVLSPRSVGYGEEKNLADEDLEFSLYDGDEVDLSPLIREQVLLCLPTRPLCREDCRGLCPHCGINLNLNQCDCTTEIADPRFAVLRNLKVGRS